MPHATLRLLPGVNTQQTPALNENSGISQSNLIRFFQDPILGGLLQKLGGWSRFFGMPFPAIVRALWAWEDLNDNAWLAVGTQTITGTSSAQLSAITDGVQSIISPTYIIDDVTPAATSTSGSSIVQITDNTTTGITNYDSVYITTQIAIGGVVLFGLYACDPDGFLGATAYTVQAINTLGAPLPATSNSTSPVLPTFTTASGLRSVTITLPGYTYAVGDTFPVLTPTTVGGVTFFGNYVVDSLVSSTQFVITAGVATSSATGTLNGGNVQFIYSLGQGALPGGTGYGSGAYGSGGYGTGSAVVPPVGVAIDAIDWTLDNWGEILIACPDRNQPAGSTPFQPIYQWDPGAATATIITAASPVNDGIFVAMPQRQIVAWGSTETGIQDPLLVSWCDVNNFNQWIPTPTNQAGQYRIAKGSRIVGAVQGPQQAMIWTDIGAWSMQYIGTPYVYSFNQVGTGCGLIGRKAAASMNGIYYWMGPSQFFTLGGEGVLILPCTVWDAVFQNLDTSIDPVSGVSRAQKIRVAVNSLFGEIQWFYCSLTGGTGEVDSYVKYNVQLNVWDYGTLGRTAWVDQSVLGPPIGADPNTLLLYQHETSNDADGQAMAPLFQTGYFALAEGDFQTFVDLVWPDMKWGQLSQAQTAAVAITFFVTDYPGDTPVQYGPYSVTKATEYFNTRLRGRLVSVRISSQDLGSFWRIGAVRYRFAPDGKF